MSHEGLSIYNPEGNKSADQNPAPSARLEHVRRTEGAVENTQESERNRLAQARQVIASGVRSTEDAILISRDSRLQTEAENKKQSRIQRAMKTRVGRFVVKPAIEMIPFPFTVYGPGDIITGLSAIKGEDVLTGDKLDKVDRALYGVATLVPFVPSGFLVEPMKLVRRHAEEAVYARKEGNTVRATNNAKKALKEGRSILKLFRR
jgi:hypothetical protein